MILLKKNLTLQKIYFNNQKILNQHILIIFYAKSMNYIVEIFKNNIKLYIQLYIIH